VTLCDDCGKPAYHRARFPGQDPSDFIPYCCEHYEKLNIYGPADDHSDCDMSIDETNEWRKQRDYEESAAYPCDGCKLPGEYCKCP
jgi:hypothetical protein